MKPFYMYVPVFELTLRQGTVKTSLKKIIEK